MTKVLIQDRRASKSLTPCDCHPKLTLEAVHLTNHSKDSELLLTYITRPLKATQGGTEQSSARWLPRRKTTKGALVKVPQTMKVKVKEWTTTKEDQQMTTELNFDKVVAGVRRTPSAGTVLKALLLKSHSP